MLNWFGNITAVIAIIAVFTLCGSIWVIATQLVVSITPDISFNILCCSFITLAWTAFILSKSKLH